jgi:hypothetical protein
VPVLSWYNILILALACLVCVEQPRLRASDRLPVHDQVAMVDTGDRASAHRVLDISLGAHGSLALRRQSPVPP